MEMIIQSLVKIIRNWKSDATGLTNNVAYKNIDALAIKGIDNDTTMDRQLQPL